MSALDYFLGVKVIQSQHAHNLLKQSELESCEVISPPCQLGQLPKGYKYSPIHINSLDIPTQSGPGVQAFVDQQLVITYFLDLI